MIIAKIFFWIIGIMFFAGAIGSALVVILTSIDDIKDLRENENSETKPHGGNVSPASSAESS
jgi:hypothetical protein